MFIEVKDSTDSSEVSTKKVESSKQRKNRVGEDPVKKQIIDECMKTLRSKMVNTKRRV